MKSKIFILFLIFGIAFSTTALAGNKECGLIGSWTGYADNSTNPHIIWSAIHASTDKTEISGTLQMNWAFVSLSLLKPDEAYNDVTHLSPGNGVWEKIDNQYKYSWYSYGINQTGFPLYSVRVSGTSELIDCDTVSIFYRYEVFNGFVSPQDMISPSLAPVYQTQGTAMEFRIPPPQLLQ